jgi:hypothetical protein
MVTSMTTIVTLRDMAQHCLGLRAALEAVCECLAEHHQALTHEKLSELEVLGKALTQHYRTLQTVWLKPLKHVLKMSATEVVALSPEATSTGLQTEVQNSSDVSQALSAWIHYRGAVEQDPDFAQHLLQDELPRLQALLRRVKHYTEIQHDLAEVSLRWTQQALNSLTREATSPYQNDGGYAYTQFTVASKKPRNTPVPEMTQTPVVTEHADPLNPSETLYTGRAMPAMFYGATEASLRDAQAEGYPARRVDTSS